jgi:hypothetical protein
LIRNYYTIYDLSANQIGFYVAAWTLTQKKLSLWGISFLVTLFIILIGGVLGCYCVYKRSKREKEVRIRTLSGEIPSFYLSRDFKGMPIAIKQMPL